MSLLSKSELELVCKKSVCKLMCDVCMSLVNKPEVEAGLRKKCMCKLVYDLCMSLVNKSELELV